MVTIPARSPSASGARLRAAGRGSGRGAGFTPSLSSGDVPQVNPGVARDPGLEVDADAFGATQGRALVGLGQAVQELSGDVANIAFRQMSREAAVDLADRINAFNREADAELRRLSTEADLSNAETLHGFGNFLATRRAELFGEHSGTAESSARLAIRLGDMETVYTGRAAALSTSIGREKVETRLNDAVTPLSVMVGDDPGSLVDAIERYEAVVDDMLPALTPGEEEVIRRAGRGQLVESAVGSLLARGDLDGAEHMLDLTATQQQVLDPDSTRRIRRKIADARAVQNEALLKLEQFKVLTGRNPTAQERTAIALSTLGVEQQSSEPVVAVADPSSPSGLRFVPRSQAAGMPAPAKGPLVEFGPQVGTIPPGFMLRKDEETGALSMEPIPGGPAAAEAERAEEAEATRTQREAVQQDVVVQDIGRALTVLDTAETPVAGTFGPLLSNIGGTAAADFRALVDSIRANIGFDRLQAMREASPTGGALGQVSERELGFLQSVLGSLEQSQSEPQIRFNLRRLNNVYLDIIHGPGQGPERQPLDVGQDAGSAVPPAEVLSQLSPVDQANLIAVWPDLSEEERAAWLSR